MTKKDLAEALGVDAEKIRCEACTGYSRGFCTFWRQAVWPKNYCTFWNGKEGTE